MRKLPAFALGGVAAAALAGTAVAASQRTHRMDVPLPGGGVVHVEYVGDVAPKVTVAPAAPVEQGGMWAPMSSPGFGSLDGMFQQMSRQVEQMARVPAGAPGMDAAAYGSMPAGTSSVSVVSTSNNGVSCTRTTEVVSQGVGKAPKVTTNASGNCGAHPQAAPQAPSGPINRT